MATTPTTLKDLATQVRDLYDAAAARTRQELADAQAALDAARAGQRADAALLTAKQAALAAARAELAATEVPIDAEALLGEVAKLQVDARRLQAALLDRGDAVARAEADVAAAKSLLARVSGARDEAAGEVEPATAEHERRVGWRAAATAAPLDTLAADATATLAGAAYVDAKKRVTDDVPAKLVASARKGHGVETARVARVALSLSDTEDLLATEQDTNGGPAGEAEKLRLEMIRAEAALRDWAEHARERYDLALAQLEALSSATTGLFTPAQVAELAALKDDGGDAVDLRLPRETAREKAIDAAFDLDDAITKARAPDPTASVSAVAAVVTARGKRDQANADYVDADGDFTADARKDFARWSAAVPEPVWRKLVGFLEAEAALDALKDVAAADLVSAHEDAEAALAASLWNAERHALSAAYLEEQVNLREALLARALSVRQQRLLSALRGDA